ncbi:TPA: hypothetical protein ACOEF8_002045 [Enterobacter roggenkampii]
MSQQENTPPPNRQSGILESFADRWISMAQWVNGWKRLAILIVLATFTLILYLSYEHRRELAYSAMVAFGTPQIDEKAIKPEISRLMADTGAIAASAWSLNLEKNQRRALYVRERERELDNLVGTGDLILRPYSQLTVEFINLIDNKTNCWKHISTTAVGKAARDSGVTWVCAAAIPPQFGTMIGMLVIGFAERPDNEDYIKLRIKQAAERVIK